MPKVRIPRKRIFIDMTAMCDVAFLLLNFLLLTSNFVKPEAVQVAAPSSISEIKMPETNILEVIVDADGKVFFGIDNQEERKELLMRFADQYGLSFSAKEIKEFSLVNSFGVPANKLKAFLDLPSDDKGLKENALGIPCDSLNNQFKDWVQFARKINPEMVIAIKADRKTPFPKIKRVMDTLRELRENRYHLITNLEEPPSDI
ncbi:MAG TPA: biopolymer transporter ExbD [Prolixibacteraceae bacterium]|nr:biopolymer transporter ExbD [Prolixibacteraceae bacterium]HPS11975.1 biopolymer transporter ExbD [Prolixibacteraceae bacterium]